MLGGGQGGENPGVKGAGSIREAGEERAGSGILKVAGYGARKFWRINTKRTKITGKYCFDRAKIWGK